MVLRYGYLLRGAITTGEFFHNDVIVYGKTLVEAINLEEKIAIYPRIIVQKEIQELLPQYFFQSADGLMVLNNFMLSRPFEEISYKSELLKMLKENKNNEKVKQKIMRVIGYFNEYFTGQKARITEEEINDYKSIMDL